jgi:hypothetical protein
MIAELEALRALLDVAQQAARPVTPRTWREAKGWREKVRSPVWRAERWLTHTIPPLMLWR